MRYRWESNTALKMKTTYAENDVSPMNVIFSVAYDTLAALFGVNRGVHDLQ
jgi:hypothetical protein